MTQLIRCGVSGAKPEQASLIDRTIVREYRTCLPKECLIICWGISMLLYTPSRVTRATWCQLTAGGTNPICRAHMYVSHLEFVVCATLLHFLPNFCLIITRQQQLRRTLHKRPPAGSSQFISCSRLTTGGRPTYPRASMQWENVKDKTRLATIPAVKQPAEKRS